MNFFIAQLRGLSHLSLFTVWHGKANVIFRQLCMKTDRAKYNREIPWKRKQPKRHKKPPKPLENRHVFFFIEEDLYEVTIKYFAECHTGGGHLCASESLRCMTKQKKRELRTPLSSESWPWVQQCLIVLFFHTFFFSTPGSWHLAPQCFSISFSRTYCKKLQGSGPRIILLHLLESSYWATRPEARIGNAQDWRIVSALTPRWGLCSMFYFEKCADLKGAIQPNNNNGFFLTWKKTGNHFPSWNNKYKTLVLT